MFQTASIADKIPKNLLQKNNILDPQLFSNYQIIDGNLNWNDYDLIFLFGIYTKGQII
jgi:hypothetical protein